MKFSYAKPYAFFIPSDMRIDSTFKNTGIFEKFTNQKSPKNVESLWKILLRETLCIFHPLRYANQWNHSTFENTGISEEFTNYQKSPKIEEIFYKILEIVFFRLFDIERKAGIFRGWIRHQYVYFSLLLLTLSLFLDPWRIVFIFPSTICAHRVVHTEYE